MVRVFTLAIAAVGIAILVIALIHGDETGVAEPSPPLTVSGELTYLERIALLPDSLAAVELRDVGYAQQPVVAEQRIELGDRQVPVPFMLEVDRATLGNGGPFQFRGGIIEAGKISWVSESLSIDKDASSVDAGTLIMKRHTAIGFEHTLQCGELTIKAGFLADAVRLTVDGESFDLQQTVAASGVRYATESDPETIFWSKGDRALLEIRGESYPECVWTDEQELVLRATGNEPAWLLKLGTRELTLLLNYGQDRSTFPVPRAEMKDGLTRYCIEDADLTVTIEDRYCSDTMTGMPYPKTVMVEHEGAELYGCGGDPASLLLGVKWIVDQIDGAELVEGTQATIEFNEKGRVNGHTSCNPYLGRYALTGEGLTIDRGSMGMTTMACLPDVMTQEQRFLDILGKVYRFDVDSEHRLILHAPDGRTMTAQRSSE